MSVRLKEVSGVERLLAWCLVPSRVKKYKPFVCLLSSCPASHPALGAALDPGLRSLTQLLLHDCGSASSHEERVLGVDERREKGALRAGLGPAPVRGAASLAYSADWSLPLGTYPDVSVCHSA